MSTIIVFAPDHVEGATEYTVWDCDMLYAGKRLASCPNKAIANRIARLLAFASGSRCMPLVTKKTKKKDLAK